MSTRPLRVAQGVRTLADLEHDGVSAHAARRRVDAKAWSRPVRGVYVARGTPSRSELAHAAVTRAGDTAVLTGLVVLHELDALRLRWLPSLTVVDVLVPPHVRRASSGAVRVTRCTQFDELKTWNRYGLRWASPDRAVIDACRHIDSLRNVRGVLLGAVKQGVVNVDEGRAILDSGQRNGSALVRRALLDAERGCASPPEAELVDALIGCGEPFLVNAEVWCGGVLLGSPDVWFVRRRVGGEVESKELHEGAGQVESTYDRHERFAGSGVELIHLSVARIRRDTAAAAGHLLARAVQATPAPADLVAVPHGPLLR